MRTNALDYINVQAHNCRNLAANVHPRMEVVVQVPKREARQNPTFSVCPLLDLQALKSLLET